MMTPKRAIVREPGDSYTRCISSHPERHTVDVTKARRQHAEYCKVLKEMGIDVVALPRDDLHADSCFVEDNAVVHTGKALICRMAKDSRRGEERDVEEALREFVKVKRATPPATIEGGDVIHAGDHLISGLSQRTNTAGVEQLRAWLEADVRTIEDPDIVHLKSFVNTLGDECFISTKRYAHHPSLKDRDVVVVRDDDWYSTNNIVIGASVVMPAGFPETERLVKDAGFDVIPIKITEFPKCEGALTCLSILL
jgi:dimethylargininase